MADASESTSPAIQTMQNNNEEITLDQLPQELPTFNESSVAIENTFENTIPIERIIQDNNDHITMVSENPNMSVDHILQGSNDEITTVYENPPKLHSHARKRPRHCADNTASQDTNPPRTKERRAASQTGSQFQQIPSSTQVRDTSAEEEVCGIAPVKLQSQN
jgi:hypothetical protein